MPTRRSHITAALAAGAAVLALPAVASAAGPMVISSPIKVKAYKMSVVASDNSLSTSLLRSAGSSSQTHYYSASTGVKVKFARTGSRKLSVVVGSTAALEEVVAALKALGGSEVSAVARRVKGGTPTTKAATARRSATASKATGHSKPAPKPAAAATGATPTEAKPTEAAEPTASE